MKNFLITGLLSIALLAAAQELRIEPLAGFGPHGDGSLRPGDYPFLTADGNRYQRGMAYNPKTGHLLIVNRDPAQQGIFIVDGTTGLELGRLDFSGFLPGGNDAFIINLVGVADDGAIYVGNLTSATTPAEFRLYRWADEGSPQTLAYAGDPSNGDPGTANRRWGDTMALRGAGTNTQILLGSRGTLASLLMPTDASLTTFTSTVVQANVPSGGLGYGVAFGPTNTFYGTGGAQSGGPLRLLQYTFTSSLTATASVVATYGSTLVANTLTPISANSNATLLAGISMVPGPDVLRLYHLPTDSAPAFLDRGSFITENTNAVFAGAVAFGPDRLYALDSDNGIMAFAIVPTNRPVPPVVILPPINRAVLTGNTATLTVAADGTAPLAYQWFFNVTNRLDGATNTSLILSNAQPANSGAYSVVISNAAGVTVSSNAMLSVTAQPVSTLFRYEPFNYAESSTVAGQGSWVLNSGSSASVEVGNLTVPRLAEVNGNRIFWGGSGMSLRLPIGTNITSSSVFYSFVMNVETIGSGFTAPGVLAGFTTGAATTFGTKVDITNNGNGTFTLGTSKPGGVTLRFDTNQFLPGTNLFIVGRYTFHPGSGDDVSELWINPSRGSFGAATPPAPNLTTTGGNDLTQIDRFFFRAGAANSTPAKLIADELRIGSNWSDVTPTADVIRPHLSIAPGPGSVFINWVAAEGMFILQSTDAVPGNWQDAPETVVHTQGTNTVSIGLDEARRFFRLRN